MSSPSEIDTEGYILTTESMTSSRTWEEILPEGAESATTPVPRSPTEADAAATPLPTSVRRRSSARLEDLAGGEHTSSGSDSDADGSVADYSGLDTDDEEWAALEREYQKQMGDFKMMLTTVMLPFAARFFGRRLALAVFPKVLRAILPAAY
ncbi:hypothetical protein H9P43_005364 [Blastocladiella emersonii ATCC 22665]|nr:hypothetical protein H9P43_005364 [Blastocladiella emersonii ATCC 22665]